MNPNPIPEHVSFVPEAAIRDRVAGAFEYHRQRLSTLLPNAETHHIGSTAVPGSLTKGDLDIQVRVAIKQFALADGVLAEHYNRNVTSNHTRTFSSFKEDSADPPLGIQLTAVGGPEDYFCRLRDHLTAHPEANERYNALKRRFEGAMMDDYRAAKSTFMDALLEQLNVQVA